MNGKFFYCFHEQKTITNHKMVIAKEIMGANLVEAYVSHCNQQITCGMWLRSRLVLLPYLRQADVGHYPILDGHKFQT